MSLILSATVMAASLALGGTDGAIAEPSRDSLLVSRPPFPATRTAPTVTRHSGVLWYSQWPIGTRTPIGSDTLAFPGPAFFGAPADASTDLIVVRTREPLPLIAISPYTQFGRVDIGLLKREMPWIRRTPTIERDIVRAQQLWLKENGLILGVRTHVNPASLHSGRVSADSNAATAPASDIQPRGVIKVHPVDPEKLPLRQAKATSAPQQTMRISLPASAAPQAPITVVRPKPSLKASQASAADIDLSSVD